MRGEHCASVAASVRFAGSSPHARGAQVSAGHHARAHGIIPACAGSTRANSPRSPSARDHPRMRGEHDSSHGNQVMAKGSSPHARGAQPSSSFTNVTFRIIPACAGSTKARGSRRSSCRDHPRMRGEHSRAQSPPSTGRGSSPHARGAHNVEKDKVTRTGIIPACAGSTGALRAVRKQARDHPRMRGEHLRSVTSMMSGSGSSPHARGAHCLVAVGDDARGIIPACAGSTPPRGASRSSCWDHPRMRGEHAPAVVIPIMRAGSSPHARGAPLVTDAAEPDSRIIPACAGSTMGRWQCLEAGGDHPRMRGEHYGENANATRKAGSSPHARGAQHYCDYNVNKTRSIPACAGSTEGHQPR